MKFEEVNNEQIWEKFITLNCPEALFQSWLWGRVQEKIGAKVTRYGAYQDNELLGVFQIVNVEARRGSFLHVRHGPVFKNQSLHLWQETLLFLKKLAKKEKSLFIRLNPLLLKNDEYESLYNQLGLVPAAIHRMGGEHCWVLDLDISEDKMLAQMRKTTRYEIKKSMKEDIKISSFQTDSSVEHFLKLYADTSKRHGFIGHTGIQEEYSLFAKNNAATLYVGAVGDKTLAAAIILYYNNQAIYHHGASVQSKIPVSYAIQWQAIRDAKKRGMNIYNFWGIADENIKNHPWAGLTLFKKGFGGRSVEYMHAHDLPVSRFYIFPRTVELIRKRLKGYD